MNKVRRILAVVLAMVMVLAISTTAFAMEGDPVQNPPTATATVKGVTEDGAVVTAYQLVTYNPNGSYEVVSAAASKGYTVGSVDASVVAAIAANPAGLIATGLDPQPNGDYTAKLTAGTYLILVTNAGSTIYNPMLVSLNVEYPNGVQPGEVDADTDYIVNGQTVYAKSTTEVIVHKDIVDDKGNVIGHDGVYDDVYAGETVYFKLSGTIPSYGPSITNAIYRLTDTASASVTLAPDVKEQIEGQIPTYMVEGQQKAAATVNVNGNTITIEYDTAYILTHGLQPVSFVYSATINAGASTFNPATNELSVTYRNNNGEEQEGTSDETYHFTFDLTGDDLLKVDSTEETSLAGAEFTLTDTKGRTFTSTSGEDGAIVFEDLKEGIYTLKETKAPAGYSLSEEEYTVVIEATYSPDGSAVVSYTVTITDKEGKEIGKITHTKDTVTGDPADIKNTMLSALPSTGGVGITIFTIVGCVIMIVAASMYFIGRRKNEE